MFEQVENSGPGGGIKIRPGMCRIPDQLGSVSMAQEDLQKIGVNGKCDVLVDAETRKIAITPSTNPTKGYKITKNSKYPGGSMRISMKKAFKRLGVKSVIYNDYHVIVYPSKKMCVIDLHSPIT